MQAVHGLGVPEGATHDQRIDRAHLKRLERVIDAEAVLARVLRDMPVVCP